MNKTLEVLRNQAGVIIIIQHRPRQEGKNTPLFSSYLVKGDNY